MPFSSVLASDSSKARVYSFGDAALAGWADDGGMLWPTQIPKLDKAALAALASKSYPELCAALLKLFVPDDDADLKLSDVDEIVLGAFSAFGSAEVVEVHQLPNCTEPLHVAELWHGPTLAFKDLGMAVLGRVLSHLLRRRRLPPGASSYHDRLPAPFSAPLPALPPL